MSSRRKRPIRWEFLRSAVAEKLEVRTLLSTAYTITALQPKSGDTLSAATDINANGDVVGYSQSSSSFDTASAWPGGQPAIVTLNVGGPAATAGGVNGIDDVVGTVNGQAAIFNGASTPTLLGTLSGDTGSFAEGVNDSGTIVGSSTDSSGDSHAFYYTAASGLQPFPQLSGYLNSDPRAINNLNEAAGYAESNSQAPYEAFRYSTSSGVQFGLISGGTSSFAAGIASNGDVVGDGNSSSTASTEEGFLWRMASSAPQSIGSYSTYAYTRPIAVNASDTIVGYGSADGTLTNSSAFVWSNGTFQSLLSLIPSNSGWTALQNATAINDSGQIVGSGTFNGQTRAFIISPVPTTSITGVISASNITTAGVSQETITIAYTDTGAPIDTTTIDATNITVTGPSGTLPVTLGTITGSGTTVTAHYLVAAPAGTFTSTGNGLYHIALASGAVGDTGGGGNFAATSTFTVNVPAAPVTTITGIISDSNITTSGVSQETVTIAYTDTGAPIDTATISSTNINVSGPSGTLAVTLGTVSGSGTSVTAQYLVAAPSGTFTSSDNGVYTVALISGAVGDSNSGDSFAASGTFAVNVPAAPATPLTATIDSPDVISIGVPEEFITVTYTDPNAAIDTTTVSANNISVTGPSGLEIVNLGAIHGSGNTVSVDYYVSAPNNTFDSSDDGTYAITVNSGSSGVSDLSGNNVAPTTGSFAITLPVNPALVSTLYAPDITDPTATSTSIFVEYSDSQSAIDQSTISASNILVLAPDSSQLTVSVLGSPIVLSSGSVIVDYTVAAPGASFPQGTYAVGVVPDAVKDFNGNGVESTVALFAANTAEDSSFGTMAPQSGSAAPTTTGSVDLSFKAQDVLTDPNGNILLVGSQNAPGNTTQAVIERLTANGQPDTTFNGTGSLITPSGQNDAFYSAAIDSSGNIVASGSQNGAFFVARYTPSGALDTSFGNGGYADISFGNNAPATAYNVAIGPGGSIVVSGTANGFFAVARLTSTGALDPSFNPGGAVDPEFTSGGQMVLTTTSGKGQIASTVLEGDGTIVGVGTSGTTVVAFRLNPDGSRDSTFGSSDPAQRGTLQLPELNATNTQSIGSAPQGIALTPGGEILICGQGASGGLAAVRLTSAGQIDTGFANGGVSTASFGGASEDADSVVVNPDTGEYTLVGTTTSSSGATQIAIAAFNPDGTPDTTFGSAGNGQVLLPSPDSGSGSGGTNAYHPQVADFAIASMQNGNLVIASSGNKPSVVRRLKAAGTASTTAVTTPFGRINGKNVKLTPITLANGTVVQITLTGGSGAVTTVDNQIKLTLSGASLLATVKASGAFTFTSVTVTGNLRSFTAPAASVSGAFTVSGTVGKVGLSALGGIFRSNGAITSFSANAITGAVSCAGVLGTIKVGSLTGTVAAGRNITSFTANSISNATILAGTNLGDDGMIGGSGTAADGYGPGQIVTFKAGTVAASFIGAGINPVDLVYGGTNDNDVLVGSATASQIRALTITGSIDSGSLFESGKFPRFVRLPVRTSPAADTANFKIV